MSAARNVTATFNRQQLSLSVMRTGAFARARAAAMPPKPPPTMTTWGRESIGRTDMRCLRGAKGGGTCCSLYTDRL